MPGYEVLYIERAAAGYPHGRKLLAGFRGQPIVWIDSYTEVFSRPGQDFQAQKRAPGLVAGVADGPLLYEAPARVCGAGGLPVFYNDQLRNCVYNCDYCFLQGMHASGHTLVFVNSADYHAAASRRSQAGAFWLSVSYLTDIMAFESILPLASEWINFAAGQPGVTLEIRTKGETPDLLRFTPVENVVLIWSLSPSSIASRYERGCASLPNRLIAARSAIDRGWRVRIAVDPVLLHPDWRSEYERMLDSAAATLPAGAVEGATYGVFRVGASFMARMAAARADSPILHHPFQKNRSLVTYDATEIDAVHERVGDRLRKWLGDGKVTFVHG